MAENFRNGTNIIAKHYTIFLGEEILEFFMAPTVKTHPSVLAQKIPALYPGAKGVADRDILETCLNSPSKNRSETDAFPHGPKSLLTDQCNLRGGYYLVPGGGGPAVSATCSYIQNPSELHVLYAYTYWK